MELTLFLLSVIRIMLPRVLLPATTALGTMDPYGREKGMLAGANVVMPNLSPAKNRKQYALYDNKICTGGSCGEQRPGEADGNCRISRGFGPRRFPGGAKGKMTDRYDGYAEEKRVM